MKKGFAFSLKVVVALLMAVIMASSTPFQTYACAETGIKLAGFTNALIGELLEETGLNDGIATPDGKVWYVADIKIATGKNREEAASFFKKTEYKDYKLLDRNLNEGTEDSYVLLGYLLTENRDEAITAVNTMEMGGGYEFHNYREFMKKHGSSIDSVVYGFRDSCVLMKKLVSSGDPMANYAYNTLNILCVPDTTNGRTGTSLGDYLLDPQRSDDDYRDLLMVCDTSTLSFINSLLACGCAGNYDNDGAKSETDRVSDPEWLTRTIDAAFAKLSSLSADELSKIETERISEVNDFRTSVNSALEAVHIGYLARTSVKKSYEDEKYETAEDLLLKSKKAAPLACFIDSLPESITASNFARVFSEFVLDGMIPKTLEPLPDVVSPWMKSLVDELNTSSNDPFKASAAKAMVSEYGNNSDLDFIATLIMQFIGEYRLQRAEIDEELKKGEKTEEELLKEYTERLESEYYERMEDDTKSTSDLAYYFGAYRILSSYYIDQKSWLKMPDKTPCRTLGDYFELIADAADLTTQRALTVSLAKNLSATQLYNLKTNGMSVMILNGGISPSNTGFFEAQYAENVTSIHEAYAEAGYAENECTIWFNSNRDMLDNDNGLAFTSDTIREDTLTKNVEFSFDSIARQQGVIDKISKSLMIVGIAGAVAGVLWAGAAFAMWAIGSTMTIATMVKVGLGCLVGAASASTVGTAATVAACFGAIGFIFTLITLVATIVLLIVSATYKIKDRDEIEYTTIPSIMLDCDLNANEQVVTAVRYDPVIDISTGKSADMNDMEHTGLKRWIALYYSRDERAGSPLMAKGETAFVSQLGNIAVPEDASPVTKFGEGAAYNINSYNTITDPENVLYLFCYTENSLNGIETAKRGKYVSNLRLSIASTEQMARDYLLNLKGYYVLPYNLTPGGKYYTFIGYSTTNIPSKAVTDIRFKYACTDGVVYWGDGSNPYACLYAKPQSPLRTSAINSQNEKLIYNTEYLFQPYCSKSVNVGDPILADSLRVFGSLTEIKGEYADYLCASWFSGGAFDFLTDIVSDHDMDGSHVFLGYLTDKKAYSTDTEELESEASRAAEESAAKENSGSSEETSDIPRPEAKGDDIDWEAVRNSDEEYLAGIAFFSGTEKKNCDDWMRLESYAADLGYRLLKIDLAAGALKYNDRPGYMYLAYTITRDPKRAITDIGVFTGEPKGNGTLLGHIDRAGVSFEVAQVFQQNNYLATFSTVTIRRPSVTNAYIGRPDEEPSARTWFWNSEWSDYKCDFLNNYPYTMKPRALYTAGPRPGAAPIRLSDVIYGTTADGIPCGRYAQYNTNLFSLATGDAVTVIDGGGWKSVHALEDHFHDTYDEYGDLQTRGTNIGLSRDEANGKDCILYLYYRNAYKASDGTTAVRNIPKRGAYVAKVEIVGCVEKDTSYDTARYLGMAYGEEIINLSSPLFTEESERYNVFDDTTFYKMKDDPINDYSDKCYYLTVTYQDTSDDAVAMMIIDYQNGDEELPQTLSLPNQYKYVIERSAEDKMIHYKKGDSVAPTVPASDEESGTDKKKKYAEGYVMYCATRRGPKAGRVQVLENLECSDPALKENPRWFAEDINKNVFYANEYMDQTIALYGYVEKYVFDIATVTLEQGKSPQDIELELGQLGFGQIINIDILNGTSMNATYIGVMRTDDPSQALQDIMILHEDHGKETTDFDYIYERVNDTSLTLNAEFRTEPLYIYTSKGFYGSTEIWGERTAITNVGVCFSPLNNSRTKKYYWNGVRDVNVKPDNWRPTNEILDVMDVMGEDEDEYAYLNAALVDYNLAQVNQKEGTTGAKQYKKDHGYTWLVYTNNSNIRYAKYEEYYMNGLVTGTESGDAALGLASVVSKNSLVVPAVVILLGGIVSGIVLILVKKRKEDVTAQSE